MIAPARLGAIRANAVASRGNYPIIDADTLSALVDAITELREAADSLLFELMADPSDATGHVAQCAAALAALMPIAEESP